VANVHLKAVVGSGQQRSRYAGPEVLVHASRLEGGAHVVTEALRSGTPVLASRIDGNLGLLGSDYRGLFAVGDAVGLAAFLAQARDDAAMLNALKRQALLRAPLFTPAAERQALLSLVAHLLGSPHARPR